MFEAILVIAVIALAFHVSGLKKRIDLLEWKIRNSDPSAANEPATGNLETSEVRPEFTEPRPEVLQQDSFKAPVQAPMEAPQESMPVSAHASSEKIERDFTGKGLAMVGIVALLFGIGFFLKYAFDQNLISQAGRVILGLIAGLAFLGLGDFLYFKEKYKEFSFFISGGGLGILYLSIYGAFGYYHLISQPLAFAGMVLVTALGVGVALRSRSIYLAALALAGGFLAPYLVSSGANNQVALLGYMIVLDLGFLALCYFKKWLALYPIVFAGTYGLFFGWMESFYSPNQLWSTLGFLTAYFLIFLIAPLLQSFRLKSLTGMGEMFFLHANAAVYFVTSYLLLGDVPGPSAQAIFFATWSAVYLLLAAVLKVRHKEDNFGAGSLLGTGLILATLVIPIQLHSIWITMAWALESLVLAALGCGLRSQVSRMFAYGLSIFTVLWLLLADTFRSPSVSAAPFWNDRFFTYIVVIAALLGIGYLLNRFKDKVPADELRLRTVYLILPVALALLVSYLEISTFNLDPGWITFSWIFGVVILCAAGFLMHNRSSRIFGLALYVFMLCRLLFIEQFRWQKGSPLLNPRLGIFLLAVGLSYALAYLYLRRKEEVHEDERWIAAAFGVAANLITVWALSLEIVYYFGGLPYSKAVANQGNLSLSILWGVYSGILMFIGIVGKFRAIRALSLCGIVIVVLKVFLYDSAQLSDIYRIVSFIALGVILLITSFVFYKHKEQIKEFILA